MSTSSGSRKAFQLATMTSTETVARTGRDSGRTIFQKNRNGPHPSRAAASSSSAGMLRKNGRSTMIVVGRANAACGRATPSGLSSRPKLRRVTYSGRMATATGNSRPRVNRMYTASRPAKENRASTNAASAAHGTTTSIVIAAIRTLLATCLQNEPDVRISA